MTMHQHKRSMLSGAIELKDGELDPNELVLKSITELQTNVDDRLKAVEGKGVDPKLTERLDRLEAKMNRPGTGVEGGDDKGNDLEAKAFAQFVRKGREALGADEIKTLRVSDDTSGGFLAPDQFVAEIIRNLVLVSNIRQYARVMQTSAGGVILPKRTGTLTAKWVGETETRPPTQPTYGQEEIPINEIACYVDISNRLLEDAAVDIASELSFDFAEEFGRIEGAAFVNGDGIKKPLGIMADPGVPYVANGNATTIQPDGLLALMYALPAYYRNRGEWILNGASIAKVRSLKDAQGRYLWQESLADGQPATLMGRPVVEAPDMADVASGAFPIAYGDIGTGFRIFDRVGLSVLRDPYTQQTNGIVRFHARRRVGAGVVVPQAIRKLKMATS